MQIWLAQVWADVTVTSACQSETRWDAMPRQLAMPGIWLAETIIAIVPHRTSQVAAND
ncbi:MAG TPA: hypothetical protein VHA06_03910 [Candidatus Angelobacter sp.]|nr:hypothetical protein [Candidatus Angelobacter sp.]